jgi:hypothetical protein
MINLQWGGLTNGKIDTSILVDVSGKGDYLEPTAAQKFLAMRDALHAATGVWINPAPGSSCYRPYATQVAFYAAYQSGTGNVAAVPGTSNHGWGRAVDITGYESSTAVWNWLLTHAGEYGYSWATGQASGERWHWESLTPPGTSTASTGAATPITEGFLMALTDAEQAEVLNAVRQLSNADFSGGPSMKDGGKSISQSLAEIHAILDQKVQRTVNGKIVPNPQIQELADCKTLLLNQTAQIGALQQAVTAIATSQGVNPSAILEAAKQGAQAALQGITLKAVV